MGYFFAIGGLLLCECSICSLVPFWLKELKVILCLGLQVSPPPTLSFILEGRGSNMSPKPRGAALCSHFMVVAYIHILKWYTLPQ